MKNIYLLLWICAGLLSTHAIAQSPCDTIITTDGHVITASILKIDDKGILYSDCGSNGEQKNSLAKQYVKAIKSQKYVFPATETRPAARRDSIQHNVIVWAGISISGEPGDIFDEYYKLLPKLGIEIGVKHMPSLRLGVAVIPFPFRTSGDNFGNKGANGEVGLICKKFIVDKRPGHINKFYGGADVRLGRVKWSDRYIGYQKTIWQRYMVCIGYQFSKKKIALDLACPIGMAYLRQTCGTCSPFTGHGLTIQPSASFGLRF